MMQILVNADDMSSSTAIETHVHQRVTAALENWADQVTRVHVHLHDENAHKQGLDKRVKMEVRLTHHQPMFVEDVSDDLYKSITGAARKLATVVQRRLDKLHRT